MLESNKSLRPAGILFFAELAWVKKKLTRLHSTQMHAQLE